MHVAPSSMKRIPAIVGDHVESVDGFCGGRRYLVAVDVIVFLYSTVQFIQLTVIVILGMSFIPSIIISTWMTFTFDQVSFSLHSGSVLFCL